MSSLAASARAAGGLVTVGIADLAVSAEPSAVLATHALGSCVGVALWDRERGCAGLIHFMLPLSRLDPVKAEAKPAMFADTGVPLLFERMYALGCKKQDLLVRVAGGGSPLGGGMFQVGERNLAMLRKLFWKNGVLIAAEDVGGSKPRTLHLQVGSGMLTVQSGNEVREL